ncbi:MAG: tyrosine-type recombinase/integrase [Cytophagaceae bacterium]|nr:tyrosine-type recombinase/integrase [Cytophagaceae bacterium]
MQNLQNELTENFKNYLQHVGYSKSSCYMLPECVRDFLSYSNKQPNQITQKEIQSFYEHLQQRPHKQKEGGLSEVYINHHIYAIRVFLNWLESIGEIKYNPISVMKFKAPKNNPRQPLPQEEIQLLFKATITLKETAILHLFYSCGLRRSEGEALNIKDVHFKQQILYVREGKGAKRRAVPMTARVTKELENYYQEERRTARAKDREAFMLNKVGMRMSGDNYNKALKEILKRTESLSRTGSGIKQEITLHHLRHSIATHLLESGLSLEYVRDFLGHAFLESTQIYTKVNQRQLNKLC